jgi:tetratricopeptide (TPR) repeat protein
MPREHSLSAHLRVSTMASWQEVARWGDDLMTPHIKSDDSIKALVQDIKQSATTADARVKAVYEKLQKKVRYVFAHVGRGGYEPHSAFEVWSNGYGDCKDQTILAVTLLRELDIDAYPALITTRSRGLPVMTVPAVTFDHMIVYIPAQDGIAETWMDTTGETSLYPGHSVGLEGQPALVVKKSTQEIQFLPTAEAAKNVANLELVFNEFSGKDIKADFTLTFHGIYEERLRSMWQYSHEKDKYFRELVGHIYSAADVTQLTARNDNNLWEPFNLTGEFNFAEVWGGDDAPVNYGFNITQLIGVFSDLHNIHQPKDRQQDYVIDPGYTLRSRLIFTAPSPHHQSRVSTRGHDVDNTYYSLKQHGYEDDGRYIVEVELTMKANRISKDKYAEFYRETRNLLNQPNWTVAFEYDKSAAELIALKQEMGKQQTASGLIAIARHHMKNGAFEKALDAATDAVKAEPKNGEAYYVLGLAQGYQNLLDESDESFIKAEALGYSL